MRLMTATAANLQTLDRVCRRAINSDSIAAGDRRLIRAAALQISQEVGALPIRTLTGKRIGKSHLRDFLRWYADNVVPA